MPTLMQKVAMPFPMLNPPLFSLISPEAVWLTLLLKENFITKKNQKSAKARRKTGPGCFACGLKVFSGLGFWLLLGLSQK